MNPNVAKLVVAVVLDVLDFTIGRVPGFELAFDALLGVAAVILWGWPGLFALWEIADPTGQVDGFVPTMTLIALTQMRRSKKTPPDGRKLALGQTSRRLKKTTRPELTFQTGC